jgi:hypothetical protein
MNVYYYMGECLLLVLPKKKSLGKRVENEARKKKCFETKDKDTQFKRCDGCNGWKNGGISQSQA